MTAATQTALAGRYITFEEALFVDTPQGRRFIGKRLVLGDRSVVWLRELKQEHVMRSGHLAFDATTFDTLFRGHEGFILCRVNGVEFTATHEVVAEHATAKDKGHLRQYHLAFRHWTREGEPEGPTDVAGTTTCPACRTPSAPERCPENCWCNCHAGPAPAPYVEWPCGTCGNPLEAVQESVFDPNFGTGVCLRARCSHKRRSTRRVAR